MQSRIGVLQMVEMKINEIGTICGPPETIPTIPVTELVLRCKVKIFNDVKKMKVVHPTRVELEIYDEEGILEVDREHAWNRSMRLKG